MEIESQKDWLVLVSRAIGASSEQRTREYHIKLLCDAGFMTQVSDSGYRMTNQGHDYLDAVRSDTVWNKTKEGAAKVGGMSLGMMKDLALAYVKQEAKEKLGIDL